LYIFDRRTKIKENNIFSKRKCLLIVDMDMDTYVPEEHIIQSENNENLKEEEEEVELVDTSSKLVTSYDRFLKAEAIPKRRYPQPSELPETITILKDEITNGTVYLVGTAHFRFFLFYSFEISNRTFF